MAAEHLHLVDTETGEILTDCPSCRALEVQLAGAESEIRGWRTRYAKLKKNRDAEARAHQAWPKVKALFDQWREATGHTRSAFTADRFELALPFLREETYGVAMIERAIQGIAYDPMTKVNRRGQVERFDGWETLFKSAGAFERYVNRAPTQTTPE